MKLAASVLSGLVAALLAVPASAATFTNYWTFTDDLTGAKVSGTLSGLSNGIGNDPVGLTAIVTEAPYPDLLLTYNYNPAGSSVSRFNYYDAADGLITASNFFLVSNPTNSGIFFVTDPSVSSSYPHIRDGSGGHLAFSKSSGTLFTTDGAVPEPATWAMMILGMGAVGFAMRRRKQTVRVAFAA